MRVRAPGRDDGHAAAPVAAPVANRGLGSARVERQYSRVARYTKYMPYTPIAIKPIQISTPTPL